MEMTRFPSYNPLKGFSVRSILGFVLAVIITALLWAILASPAAHAEDGSWDGASIKYNGVQYISAGKITSSDGSGLPVDSPYYMYVEKYQAPGSSTKIDRARVIYFSPGVDPPKATAAKSVYFNYDTKAKTFSNPYEQKDITLAPQASSPSGTGTSCAVEGIGWIVCPVMNFLAGGMDFVFGVISQYMEVQPLETGNIQGSLYSAWNIMRNIANVVFIILFLLIIYAQITSYKTTEFGLKRLLPRLIIAAVAINLSYIICAIAVDLSNVLGYSLQDVFYGLRDQLLSTGGTDNTAQILSWQSVTAFVVSGGTAALAATVGVGALLIASGGSVVAAVFLLLPSLVGLLVAVLVVLLILAARQALIIILVIIAPVAIVLYLLPNTEKWFNKWRDLFMTLLIFFPAFSVVFGGSQLAGAVIIKNATSINLVILGMIVQVAPLVITPLLLKFSGNLLGGLARLVNDPNKGLIDRTRKWSGEHAEYHRKRGISGAKRNGDPGELRKRNFARQSARYLDQRKRKRADRGANFDTATQTAYENSPRYTKLDRNGNEKYNMAVQKAAFEADKSITHDSHSSHVEHAKRTPGSLMYNRAINAQASKEIFESEQNLTNEHFNTQRTIGGTALNHSMMQLEASKLRVEMSDNNKNIYVSQEKQRVGSTLNGLVSSFETSKIELDGSQQRYTAMVEKMKLDPSNALHDASKLAQSSKEQVEAAQLEVQAMFDRDRKSTGTVLNDSLQTLTFSKEKAAGAQADVAQYVANLKAAKGTQLHTQVMKTELAKQQQSVAETALAKAIDEYKAGAADTSILTASESAIMDNMARATEDLAAETQGAQNAKNAQTKRIAEAYTETQINPQTGKKEKTTRALELLNIAKGVDEFGDVRAEASALATLEDLVNKARTANESLLEEYAVANKMTPKDYVVKLIEDRLGGDMSESEDLIRAAMEIAGKEAQIPFIRKMRMSGNFNQDHLSAMLLRNATTMKTKGGFDLQADMSLAGASNEEMNASIAGTLGSVAPDQIAGMKNGAIKDYAKNFDTIIQDTKDLNSAGDRRGVNGMEGILKTYTNLTVALNDPDIVRTLGDNLVPAIQMHSKIHSDPRFHDDNLAVDYAKIDPLGLANGGRPW